MVAAAAIDEPGLGDVGQAPDLAHGGVHREALLPRRRVQPCDDALPSGDQHQVQLGHVLRGEDGAYAGVHVEELLARGRVQPRDQSAQSARGQEVIPGECEAPDLLHVGVHLEFRLARRRVEGSHVALVAAAQHHLPVGAAREAHVPADVRVDVEDLLARRGLNCGDAACLLRATPAAAAGEGALLGGVLEAPDRSNPSVDAILHLAGCRVHARELLHRAAAPEERDALLCGERAPDVLANACVHGELLVARGRVEGGDATRVPAAAENDAVGVHQAVDGAHAAVRGRDPGFARRWVEEGDLACPIADAGHEAGAGNHRRADKVTDGGVHHELQLCAA
mmetsp:Transcript_46763/g.138150  ORF Transcript_46763/g.138150 Transcript_46763/m.138150 type:complete len:338 (+) Transcript_46763:116-1129(+)